VKLTKAGQFINVDNGNIENVLDFDNGAFSLVISDFQYQQILNFLQGAKRSMGQVKQRETFYIDESQVDTAKTEQEEDGVEQV
jgi:hypothetical protein